MKCLVPIAIVALLASLAGCGSSTVSVVSNGGLTAQISIATSTSSTTVVAGGSVTFSASVSGTSNTGVTWSIQEGNAGGNVDSAGKYHASCPGTYHVVATSVADPTKSAVITVTVTAPPPGTISMTIVPANANLLVGGSQSFFASIAGGAVGDLTWSVQEGASGGSISATGVYTAPQSAGTVHVVGSLPCVNVSATATVNVSAPVGSFTQSTPVGTYGRVDDGGALAQLGDGSVLTVGGSKCTVIAPDGCSQSILLNTAAIFSVDNSGTLFANQIAGMVYARSNTGEARMAGGRVLVAGGIAQLAPASAGGGAATATAEIYDPQTKSFTVTGSMSTPRVLPTMVPLKDGTVMVIGGTAIGQPTPGPITGEIYDPASGTFGNQFSIPSLLICCNTGGTAPSFAVLQDGRVLIAGGYDGTAIATSIAQIYDPATKTFTRTGNMTSPRIGATATVLADGTVLVAGGGQSADTYDPATGTFTPTANNIGLINPSSILLPNGKVLVTGTNSSLAELYDPATRTFSAAAQMPGFFPASRAFGLFLMPNGTVMATEGPSSFFDFYHP